MRDEFPRDIIGQIVSPGDFLLSGDTRVYRQIGWAYVNGQISRVTEQRWRRGGWGDGNTRLYHTDVLLRVSPDELPTEPKDRRRLFRERVPGAL